MLYLMAFATMFALMSCAEHTVVNDELLPKSISSSEDYSGHLQFKNHINQETTPSIVKEQTLDTITDKVQSESLYSLSAVDASVKDILYYLAEQSDSQIDIWQGVDGLLTLNVINQPLIIILQRIAEQLSLSISLKNNHIIARPDKSFWKSYSVDYVNIKRSSSDSIVMNMTVGGSINPVVGNQSAGSRSSVTVYSEHDFWLTLRTTLLSMINYGTSNAQSSVKNIQTDKDLNINLASTAVPNISLPVVVNPEAGLVLVYATNKTHLQVQGYLDTVTERVERQVLIEASVVEVVLSKQHQSGIDWSNTGFKNLSNRRLLMNTQGSAPLADNIFTADLGGDVGIDFTLGLKLLEKFGDVKVLSSPKIMAVNNQSALLKVVDNQVYFTVSVSRSTSTAGTDVTYSTTVHTVPVGFMMSMTPFVNDNREISLNIRPTISRIIGTVMDPNPDLKTVGVESLIPIVQEREIETVLKLRDQQTAIIGGLIEDREDKLSSGIPWLSRIPLLGKWIFGYQDAGTTKTELVIFIRPIIVDRPDIDDGDLTQFRHFLRSQHNQNK